MQHKMYVIETAEYFAISWTNAKNLRLIKFNRSKVQSGISGGCGNIDVAFYL